MKVEIDETSALGLFCMLKNEYPTNKIMAVVKKRTDGTTRRMVFNMNLDGQIKGTGPSKIFGGKGLITVNDMRKKAPRSICLEGVLSLKVGDTTYRIKR